MPVDVREINTKRVRIRKIIDGLAETAGKFKGAGLDADSLALHKIAERLGHETFKVLVIGEFKNGKSSLINSLLGEDILPAYSVPCTAIINEIIYGEEKKAVLYFQNPMPENFLRSIRPETLEHIEQHRNDPGGIPPMEISIDDLEGYVTIPEDELYSDNVLGIAGRLPYSRAVIYYPLSLCMDGVEIIDTPGLNENGIREKITMDYLDQADAVIMVFKCPALLNRQEMEYINIIRYAHENIFFVCNAIDTIDEGSEREDFIRSTRETLSELTGLKNGVFFTSTINSEGIPELEAALSEYLSEDKGRKKLMVIRKALLSYIDNALKGAIHTYREALRLESEKLKRNLERAAKALELAGGKKTRAGVSIDRMTEFNELSRKLQETFIRQYDGMISGTEEYVSRMELENKISLWGMVFNSEDEKKTVCDEIQNNIKSYVEAEISRWLSSDEIRGILEKFCSENIEKIAQKFKDVEESISSIGRIITGTADEFSKESLHSTVFSEGMNIYDKIDWGYSAVNLLAGLTGTSILNIITSAGLLGIAGAAIVGIAGLVIGLFSIGKKTNDSYKKQVSDKIISGLRDKKAETCMNLASKITDGFIGRLKEYLSSLEAGIRKQEGIISDLRSAANSEAESEERKARITLLDSIEHEIDEHRAELEAITL